MVINLDIYDKIFNILKTVLTTESIYNPIVSKEELRQFDRFPLVVFTEGDNSYLLGTTRFEQTKSRLEYEINVYTTDKKVGDKIVSRKEIAKELVELIDNVMNCNLRMIRRSCRPTPNLDENIYRITLRYRTNLNDNTGKLF